MLVLFLLCFLRSCEHSHTCVLVMQCCFKSNVLHYCHIQFIMKASLCILVLGLLALSSMASARKLSAAREATLSGNCLPNNTLIDTLATTATTAGNPADFVTGFATMRNEFVNYNMKKR